MSFKINISNWSQEYIANSSLALPDSDRHAENKRYILLTGAASYTAPAVIASTSNLIQSGYVLDLSAHADPITAGHLAYLANTGTNDLATSDSDWEDNIDQTRGYTFEFQIKNIVSSDNSIAIHWDDGVNRELLNFTNTSIGMVWGTGGQTPAGTYAMDTTDDFHTYRVKVIGSSWTSYVDNGKVQEGVLALTSGMVLAPPSGRFVQWGYPWINPGCGGRSQWGFFRYRTDGAFPPTQETDDGWTYSDLKILDKRRVAKRTIIRSDNNIVPLNNMQPTKVQISGTIAGSDYVSYRRAVQRFKRVLRCGNNLITMDDPDTRYMEGIHSAFNLTQQTQDMGKYKATFDVRYPYPYARIPSYFATAPASASTFYVTNNGDIEVPLRLIVTGAASGTIDDDILIENATMGQKASLTGVLQQTAELSIDKGYFDYNTYSVMVGTADSFGSYDGDLFTLGRGTNFFVFTGGAVGTMEFYWREAFHL